MLLSLILFSSNWFLKHKLQYKKRSKFNHAENPKSFSCWTTKMSSRNFFNLKRMKIFHSIVQYQWRRFFSSKFYFFCVTKKISHHNTNKKQFHHTSLIRLKSLSLILWLSQSGLKVKMCEGFQKLWKFKGNF